MKPVDFEGAVPFGKPKNWDDQKDGPCGTLPVLVNDNHHVSLWAFSDEDRKAVADGANMHLNVLGAQPPVMLWLTNPHPAAPAEPERVEPPAKPSASWRRWRWPQWSMLALLVFQIYMSFHMQAQREGIDLNGILVVLGWVGLNAFLMRRGGFWK